jgi:hypothetical protein
MISQPTLGRDDVTTHGLDTGQIADSQRRTRVLECRPVRLEDVDGLRRSLAIGGTLTRGDTERLLDTCQVLLEQRIAIAAVLTNLPATVSELRGALNELHRIVR